MKKRKRKRKKAWERRRRSLPKQSRPPKNELWEARSSDADGKQKLEWLV